MLMKVRKYAVAVAAVSLSVAGLTVASPVAHASGTSPRGEGQCDDRAWDWVYGKTGEFTHKGRIVTLWTGKFYDEAARARATSIKAGDRVWIERSKEAFEMEKEHQWLDEDKVGTVRICGPKTARGIDYSINTDNVFLQTGDGEHSYAVRACIWPEGAWKGKCSKKFYVDHLEKED